MVGKTKVRGLAVLAVLVLGAVVTPGALATPSFKGLPTPHTLIAGTTETSSTEQFANGAGIKVECHGKFTGTSLTGEESELTITPEYTYPDTSGKTDCLSVVAGGNFTTDVSMNGCDYVLHPGTKLKEGEYKGTVDLKCPEGKKVDVKITKIGSEETKCTLELGEQNGLSHAVYKNKEEAESKDVTVEVTLEAIKYTTTGGLLNCGQNNGEHSTGTYTNKVTLQGTDTAGEAVDLEVEEGAFKGLPTPHTLIAGTTETSSTEQFANGAGIKVECHGKFTGTSLTGEESELTITPEYTYPDTSGKTDCLSVVAGGNFTTDVSMNGCDYLLHSGVKLKEGEYKGTVDLKCPEGKKVDVKITKIGSEETKCTLELGEQNGLSHAVYKNIKEAESKDVTVEVTLEAIKYTTTGGLLNCGQNNGEHSTGTYTNKVTLQGTDTAGEAVDLEVEEGAFKGLPTPHTLIAGTTETSSTEQFGAGIKVECHGKFTGTSLTGEESELTITPEYTYPDTSGKTDCLSRVGETVFTTHVSMNGCDYVLHPGTKLKEGEYKGTVDLKCPEGKKVDVKITKIGSEETKCTLELGEQNGLSHAVYKNKEETESKDVTVEVTLEAIKYTTTGGILNCGIANGEHSGATYTSKVTLQGTDTAGKAVDLEVEGE